MSTKHKRTIRALSHCFYDLKYHLVFTPKYRGKVLGQDKIKQELFRIFGMICKWKHWEILELSIQEDHIHNVLTCKPKRFCFVHYADTERQIISVDEEENQEN